MLVYNLLFALIVVVDAKSSWTGLLMEISSPTARKRKNIAQDNEKMEQ